MDNDTERTRVTALRLGRVYNLGNYENAKYDVTVSLAPTDRPSAVLGRLEEIFNDLRATSKFSEYELDRARNTIARVQDDADLALSEYQQQNREQAQKLITRYDEALKREVAAREKLDELSPEVEYNDAKDNWEEEDH